MLFRKVFRTELRKPNLIEHKIDHGVEVGSYGQNSYVTRTMLTADNTLEKTMRLRRVLRTKIKSNLRHIPHCNLKHLT
jgi:hypothetical protein